MSALITCIVPTHNGERYIKEALDSVLAQTYRPIEIVVIDDGSTDGTRDVVMEFGDSVRYRFEPDVGPPAARNAGLSEARGEFVAFLDGDDLWHPEKLERQMARFIAHPELDYCLSYVRLFWIPELKDEEAKYKDHERVQPPGYATTTMLARRSAFDRVGGFNPGLWFPDSADWFSRATDAGLKSEVLSDVLLFRRMHHSNLTRRKTEQGREEWLQFLKASLDRRRVASPLGPTSAKE
ncbi:MAG: glycosyltransferase family A protein [Gemmatimonadaceae bacterium]